MVFTLLDLIRTYLMYRYCSTIDVYLCITINEHIKVDKYHLYLECILNESGDIASPRPREQHNKNVMIMPESIIKCIDRYFYLK